MSKDNNLKLIHEAVGRIGGELLRAHGRSAARSAAAVFHNLVTVWSGPSAIKRKISMPVQWVLGRIMRAAPGRKPAPAGTVPADIARIATLVCAMVGEAHAKGSPDTDPDRGESTRAFLENLDFGEIMEMVEGSDPYVLKAVETFNEELWKYPAKVGTLVATLIPLINIIIKAVREVLVPIEKSIGPDMLADIVLSLVKGVNGADTAGLINTLQEVLRRVHTGSLLLGKGGKPLMEIYLTDVLKACLSQMNPELLKKARVILSEDKLSITRAASDALSDNPDLTVACLASLGSVQSSAIKAKARKLRVYEDLDRERLMAALSESLSDLDTYEAAELVNSACRLLNRMHSAEPGFLLGPASGIADLLDRQEIENTVKWLVGDLVQALKPLAPVFMPALINGISEMIGPDGGHEGPEQAEAVQGLRATLARVAGGGQ